MLARVALVLALLLASPVALAGPIRDAAAPAISDARTQACGLPEATGAQACATSGVVNDTIMWLELAPSVDTARSYVCASPDSFQCRQVDGRPVSGGAMEACVVEPVPTPTARLYWHAVNGGNFTYVYMGQPIEIPFGPGIDPAIRSATSTAFAGTPLEGESLCHDHWSTARGVLLLV